MFRDMFRTSRRQRCPLAPGLRKPAVREQITMTTTRPSVLGLLTASSASDRPGPIVNAAAPRQQHLRGSHVYRCGDSYHLQTWEERDDIAPGFRLGVVRQLS